MQERSTLRNLSSLEIGLIDLVVFYTLSAVFQSYHSRLEIEWSVYVICSKISTKSFKPRKLLGLMQTECTIVLKIWET